MIDLVTYRLKVERRRFEVVFDLTKDAVTVRDTFGRAEAFGCQYQSAGEAERFAERFISETQQEARETTEVEAVLPKQQRLFA